MGAFGLGAGLPLVALGAASRSLSTRLRHSLLVGGKWGKGALGAALASVGLLIATGLDKPLGGGAGRRFARLADGNDDALLTLRSAGRSRARGLGV